MLTAAQHCDAWSHIQVQGRFERVAGCCTHTADQKREPHCRGSSSLHLHHRASHGTRTLSQQGAHACRGTHTNMFTLRLTYTHIHTQSDKHWQESRQCCRMNLKKHTKATMLVVTSTREDKFNVVH